MSEVLHRYLILWPILNPHVRASAKYLWKCLILFQSSHARQCFRCGQKPFRLRLATQFRTISAATDTKRRECAERSIDNSRLFFASIAISSKHDLTQNHVEFSYTAHTDIYFCIPPSASHYALVDHLVQWICPNPAYEILMMRAHRCRLGLCRKWCRCVNAHRSMAFDARCLLYLYLQRPT